MAVFSLKNSYTCGKIITASDTFYIKLEPHFKLLVSLKDKIVFEAALYDSNIPFHIDDNQSTVGNDIRYFFQDIYRAEVDNVVKSIGIIAGTETIQATEYELSRRLNKLYFATGVIVVLFVLAVIVLE